MAVPPKKCFFIKVIEAHGVLVKSDYYVSEPFVSIKMNGNEFSKKRTTNYHMGRQWWDRIFNFSTSDIKNDWLAVEVREKGYHLLGSDWIGEVKIRIKDYADGKVHQKWFKLGGGAWKSHTRKPRGAIHLAFQLASNKNVHPFNTPPIEETLTYEQWNATSESGGEEVRLAKGVVRVEINQPVIPPPLPPWPQVENLIDLDSPVPANKNNQRQSENLPNPFLAGISDPFDTTVPKLPK